MSSLYRKFGRDAKWIMGKLREKIIFTYTGKEIEVSHLK